jgi:hypothetical protein
MKIKTYIHVAILFAVWSGVFLSIMAGFILPTKNIYDEAPTMISNCYNTQCFTAWLVEHKLEYWDVIKRSFWIKSSFLITYHNSQYVTYANTHNYVYLVYITFFFSLIGFLVLSKSLIRNHRRRDIVRNIPQSSDNMLNYGEQLDRLDGLAI